LRKCRVLSTTPIYQGFGREPKLQLKGKRCGKLVCLREMNEADALPYVRWLQDPEIATIVGAKQIPSVKERIKQLKHFDRSSNDLVLGIELRDTAKLIGTIGLRDIDWSKHIAEAAIFIGEKHEWNKGYGTEAMKNLLKIGFKELNLRKIKLSVNSSNQRALHVFKKAGFKEETTRKRLTIMIKESE